MTYNRLHAKALLNSSELTLFEHSVGPALTGWSAAQLGQKLKRASALRDKYRDLLRRQKLATRTRTGTKSGVSGDANARTAQKAKLFDEVLRRLEGHRAKLAAAEVRTEEAATRAVVAKRKAQKPSGPAAPPRSSKRKAVPVKEGRPKAPGFANDKAARERQLISARTKVIQTHIASQGRRRQAARDKR